MLATGSVLQGRYSIEKVLGQGGMGSVYLAREVQLGGKRVAVKEMHVLIENPVDRQRAVEQFHKEAQILANLEHPGLVDVTHYFEEANKQYLVMAFIDGITLEGVLGTAPALLPTHQVLEWSDQLCDVLEYLHGQNPTIIFRDLKPSNIMLDVRGRIRLIDFGIARVFDSQSKTATFIKGAGTPGFAPVEQYGRGATDPRSDIYALGATLYALLTRRVPPASVDLVAGIDTLVPASEFNPEIPPALDAALMKMMAMKKEDRYQSVGEARLALRQILAGTAPSVEKPGPYNPSLPVDTGRTFVQQRFCTNCGATVVPMASACGRCGQPLESSTLVKEPVPSPPSWPPSPATGDRTELPQFQPTQPHPSANAGWNPPQPSLPMPIAPTMQAPASPPIPVVPAEQPTRRSPLPMVAVVLVLVLGLGFAATKWKAPTPSPTTAPTTPAPQPSTSTPTGPAMAGTVHVETVPPGATVKIDNTDKGKTPLDLAGLSIGLHDLEIAAAGLAPMKVRVDVQRGTAPGAALRYVLSDPVAGASLQEANGLGRLTLHLAPLSTSLVLQVTPDRVEVVVDDKVVKQLAATGDRIPVSPGTHMVAIHKKDYVAHTVSVDVKAGQDLPLTVRLIKKEGTLDLKSSPPGASVEIDGKPAGKTPLTRKLSAHPHALVLQRSGYLPYKKEVSIEIGKTATLDAHLEPEPPPEPRYVPPPQPRYYPPPPPPVHEAPPIRG